MHLSSVCRIIDGDQAPTSNKGRLLACLESVEPASKSAEPIAACPESARPTASAAFPESARPTSQSAKPTALASAQVGLADFQSAKPTFLVSAAADASSDDSAPIVDRFLEMKSNII